MTKTPSDLRLSSTLRLPTAFMAVAVLTGCANQGSNNISAFALDATTGALTVVAGSPFAAGTEPSSVTVDPTGMFAYVVNSGADTVFVYSIDATTGALTPIGGSPFATATQPTAIAISD